MKETIVVKGKRLVYSSKYHGYIDPEWHAGVRGRSIHEEPTVWRFRETRHRVKRHHR